MQECRNKSTYVKTKQRYTKIIPKTELVWGGGGGGGEGEVRGETGDKRKGEENRKKKRKNTNQVVMSIAVASLKERALLFS